MKEQFRLSPDESATSLVSTSWDTAPPRRRDFRQGRRIGLDCGSRGKSDLARGSGKALLVALAIGLQ